MTKSIVQYSSEYPKGYASVLGHPPRTKYTTYCISIVFYRTASKPVLCSVTSTAKWPCRYCTIFSWLVHLKLIRCICRCQVARTERRPNGILLPSSAMFTLHCYALNFDFTITCVLHYFLHPVQSPIWKVHPALNSLFNSKLIYPSHRLLSHFRMFIVFRSVT